MDTQTVTMVIVLSYAIGSFPSAYVIGRLNGINIFEHGSGNMGATNVIRTLGLFWGLIVMAGDIGKGILAVWVARQLAPADPLSTQASASVISALAVICGHNWSFIASLITGSIKGGKGAATAAGTWLILMPTIAIAIPFFIWAVLVITTRYMSLAVMSAAVVASLIVAVMVFRGDVEPAYLLATLVGPLILHRHRENIKRLLAGNERRLGERTQTTNQ